MFSNFKRVMTLTLLASAAGSVAAAPAPVSTLNLGSTAAGASSQAAAPTSTQSEIQRLQRQIESRNQFNLQLQQQVADMSQEINQLRGQLEVNTHQMQQMVTRQRELFIELDKLRSQVNAPKIDTTTTAQQEDHDTAAFSNNATEQEAYQKAIDLILNKKDYQGAIFALQNFQKNYPKSKLTPNAHYWLGQLYFANRDFAKSEENFKAVLNFKDSPKRADSLVKLGDIAKQEKDSTKAKAYFEQAIKEYPNSASAQLAKERLK
ncbi:tol-pal system protein YbgF [Vibrio marisflavi]|uniref:Cell division coordinator CpoB n=1 Tax=Vibrio marisflavi CECT 7928 TaxID=634439 RepID=A0ABN8E5G6_9VIBR|nr:tol-pal system protein YbgF [Vibrio marisflavi]CAH0539445.1 Cell division coordinator CpoB [Vibrio marisflavi CECT 7928]